MQTHQIKSLRSAQELMKENMLVKHYAGSISYGTNLPTSDIDFRGIFAADPINVRTPFFTVKECEDTSEEDTKLCELAHFMKLTVDCNPNIIETLWVDDIDITFRTPAYDLLREHRHELLSSKIAFTTSGYALAQLKRIKGHNKWINNPQSVEPPRQIDFVSLVQNFTGEKLFRIDMEDLRLGWRLIHYGHNIFGLIQKHGYESYSNDFTLNTNDESVIGLTGGERIPSYVVKFNKEEYNLAKEKHKQYWDWKKNRNEARSELEESHGYDTKHAMHLVRLLRMGVEALRDGEIIVKRPDAKELLSIRDGAWSYEEIVAYAEKMDKEVREVWYKKTDLRKKPDLKFAGALLMDVQDLVWSS
jgi:predicted nucleotidyltransferase